MSASIETILFELRAQLKSDEAKAGLDQLAEKIKGLEPQAAPEIKFRGIATLKDELRSLEKIRDNALDFPTAADATRKIKLVEKEVDALEAKLNSAAKSGGGAFSDLGSKISAGFKDGSKDILNFAAGGLLTGGVTAAADLAVKGITAVIDIGSQYQASMAELQAITGVSGDALTGLSDDARGLALEFGTSGKDQLESYKGVLSRLGPDIASVPAALKEITHDVNILSKATGDDAAASMDALTTAALQFGTDLSDPAAAAEDITKKMNTMAAGAKVGAAEVPQVAEALKQVGVAAKSANISFEETNAAIQVLAAGGKFGSEGGVAIRNVIGLVQKTSGEGAAALKQMGIGANELGELITTKGLGPAMERLHQGMDTYKTDAERNKALITLFGQENSASAGILLRSTDQLNTFTEGVTGTNTAFEQAAIRQATFGERVKKVGAFFEDLAVTIFQAVGDALGFISDHIEEVSIAFVVLTGGIGLLPLIIGEVVAHFTEIVDAISDVASSVGNFLGLTSDVDDANTHATSTVHEAAKAYKEYSDGIGAAEEKLSAATGTEKHVARLEELQNKTKLSANEQKELTRLTDELGSKFPEATSGVNALTGAFEVNTGKLKDLSKEQLAYAGADKKKLIEENLWKPTKDLLPALDAQKAKLGELRTKLDEAIKAGDKDKILESRDAYNKQSESIKGNEEQLKKNLEGLIKYGVLGKGSVEEIAKGMNISNEEAAKLAPLVAKTNHELAEQKKSADETAQSVAGIAAAFNEEVKAANSALNETKAAYAKQVLNKKEALAAGNKEAAKAADEEKKKLEEVGHEQVGKVKDNNAAQAEADRLFNTNKTKSNKDAYDEAIKALEITNKKRETETLRFEGDLQRKANDEFIAGIRTKAELSQSEEKKIAQRRLQDRITADQELKDKLANLDTGGTATSLKVVVSTKEAVKDIADLNKRIVDNALTIEKDRSAIIKMKVEVEVPKVQAIGIDPEVLAAHKKQFEQSIQLRDLRIGNIADVDERELASLKQKQERELSYYTALHRGNTALTFQEAAIENEILKKQGVEREALLKKQFDRQYQLTKVAADQIGDLFSQGFAKSLEENRKLSGKDLVEKQAGFQKEVEAARNSFSKGESNYRQFQDQLKRISADRAAFEAKQNAGAGKVFTDGLKHTYEFARDAAAKWLLEFAEKKILEAAITASTEAEKTGASAIGQAARAVIAGAEVVADLGVAAAKGVAAAAAAAYNAIVSLPFPFDLAAAVGSVASVAALFGGLTGMIKFETGGLGLVGEKGPEIIGPTQDFSQFASQLIAESMRKTEQILKNDNQGKGGNRGGGSQKIIIEGNLTGKTRDLNIALRKEQMSSQLERI